MASQGASLQNYNNELVKCARPWLRPRPPATCRVWFPALPGPARPHGAPSPAGIEDLKEKREEVNRQILQDEEEKQKIQNDLRILTERCPDNQLGDACGCLRRASVDARSLRLKRAQPRRLSRINDSLARKVASRNEYDKTIMETEAAYMKILESSQVHRSTRVLSRLGSHSSARSSSSGALASFLSDCSPGRAAWTDVVARAQAREREPDQEEASVQLSTSINQTELPQPNCRWNRQAAWT